MKLIIAVVQDEDVRGLLKGLAERQLGATQISSTGGFLRRGNATIMIGVQSERVDEVIGLIRENCRSRTEVLDPAISTDVLEWYVPQKTEVRVGGATVFVLDVERTEKA
jgi:uncharacterized protein YaaQ